MKMELAGAVLLLWIAAWVNSSGLIQVKWGSQATTPARLLAPVGRHCFPMPPTLTLWPQSIQEVVRQQQGLGA